MTEKVQKIREKVEKLKSQLLRGACSSQVAMETRCKEEAYNDVLDLLDAMQEEPKKCMFTKDSYTDKDRKVLCEGCKEECKYSKSDDFTKALAECIHQAQGNVINPMVLAETWKDELIKLAKSEEPVSEDLEEASLEYWKHQLDSGEDTLRDAFKAGAEWQEHKFEKNRLNHCNSITNEQAELEQEFIDQHLDKHQRMPTFLDAIEYGMNLQKEQMMANAIDAEVLENYDGKILEYDGSILNEKLSNCKVFDKVKIVVIKKN